MPPQPPRQPAGPARRFLPWLLTLGLLLHAPKAAAMIRITNLSDEPQAFLLTSESQSPRRLVVKPNQTWRTSSPFLRVAPLEQGEPTQAPIRARTHDHYAYWPDGTFALQYRQHHSLAH